MITMMAYSISSTGHTTCLPQHNNLAITLARTHFNSTPETAISASTRRQKQIRSRSRARPRHPLIG